MSQRLQSGLYYSFYLCHLKNHESSPSLESTISLLYLGIVATGLAWLIRFKILSTNGLVFQTQVAYLIPILEFFWLFCNE